MNVAIISFFHTESSICLANYIARQGYSVDYYFISDCVRDKGEMAGIKYKLNYKKIGLTRLSKDNIPEIYDWTGNLNVNYYIIRLFSFSKRVLCFNKVLLKLVLGTLKKRKYDYINIVGQYDGIELFDKYLEKENIIHTLHEVGSHQRNIKSSDVVDYLIKNDIKTILHSKSTYERFMNAGGNPAKSIIIPFGKFETTPLYDKEVTLSTQLDLNLPTFLFYGYITPYKGLDLLAKALEYLKDIQGKFNIIIAGAGNDPNIAFFCGLNNCYVLNRYLSNDEMTTLIKLSSIVVLPYHSASQTGIIPTCFMYNKPVIATKVGAFEESIIDGFNGLLSLPEDPLEFSIKMRSCIENPDIIKKLSQGASCYGHGDYFDWNIIASKTIDFYKR